jgi:GNAT superfamily N-acetyltransferase
VADHLLAQGIAALKAGCRAEAREFLKLFLVQDNSNEVAWLWLSGAVDTDQERCACLQNALRHRTEAGLSDSRDEKCTAPVVSVELLADNLHLVPALAEIRWREWGVPPDPDTLEAWVDITSREAGRDDLPITWVAIDSLGHAAGTVALDHFDIDERRDRSPWVVGVIVAPQRRGMGIGTHLMGVLESWAHRHGYARAWVATAGRAVDFYQKCGWELAEIIAHPSDDMVSVLTKAL